MHLGKRVLLVDGDPQCNATQSVLEEDLLGEIYWDRFSARKTLYHYLKPLERGEPSIEGTFEPVRSSENAYKTDLIAGHPNMSLVEDRLSQAWSDLQGADPIRGYRISNWMSQLLHSIGDRYDLIVFDVGPSLGALNRTILLSCDYIVTPFGSDIFSLLGIRNISAWIKSWSDDYERAVANLKRKNETILSEFSGIVDTSVKFRLAGYSVQQYVKRKFKEKARPVKAYDEIIQDIPETVQESLGAFIPDFLKFEDLELGHVPFLYSLVPLAQSQRVPIHALTQHKAVVGNQVRQVADYAQLMKVVCHRLLNNVNSQAAADVQRP